MSLQDGPSQTVFVKCQERVSKAQFSFPSLAATRQVLARVVFRYASAIRLHNRTIIISPAIRPLTSRRPLADWLSARRNGINEGDDEDAKLRPHNQRRCGAAIKERLSLAEICARQLGLGTW